ncbi:lactate utilization protein C [[Mycobacterium] wendilense]|uniref:Lactate utilization protein C n=1 Tax=[Mycobacterium] wendilense TaxID=3064284 RepID=A0ABM9MEI2_9MYCO|nr:lactate utilization protein C [Mycolicibacterium sp. MU0050]CAJ1583298.1 lactate utilization protein C [Mycolicibacterium sp. MU0050]
MTAGGARTEILRRVRAALADRTGRPGVEIPWRYGVPVHTGGDDLVRRFVERTTDYRAAVVRVSPGAVAGAIADALVSVGARTVLADAQVRHRWSGAAAVRWLDDDGRSAAELDRVDAVLTTATVAIANTGTLVLDHGPGQGRRALSLVPDVHICVVDEAQIVSDVPEAVARLVDSGLHTRPLTWISGPSATSDIELSRVEGVHGPRTLHVIVVGESD